MALIPPGTPQPPRRKGSGVHVTGGVVAGVGGLVWLVTYPSANACSNPFIGAFATRQCAPYQFWHTVGMLAFIIGAITLVTSLIVAQHSKGQP